MRSFIALAETAFGTQGLVDITFLAGIYQLVCGLLSAFEIPAPVAGPLDPSRPDQAGGLRKATVTTAALFPAKIVPRESRGPP